MVFLGAAICVHGFSGGGTVFRAHRTVTRIVDTKFRNIEPVLASALSPAQELIGSLVIFVTVGKELEIEIPTKVTFAVALIGYHK